MQNYYPELVGTSHFAVLYLDGALTKIWCHVGGWTQILVNENQADVSSLTLTDF